ncbi:unnamed protein product [Euphydryas editha]|nr:unnamed protein product [Euphydryas editha]
MGDFNLPDLKWPLQNVDADRYNTLHGYFVDMYVNSNLDQLVTCTTRKRNNEESLLDLILCNEENLCSKVEYHPNIGKSDHLVLIATMQIDVQSSKKYCIPSQRRIFFKADYDEINKTLLENNVMELECLDANIAWRNFSKIITLLKFMSP